MIHTVAHRGNTGGKTEHENRPVYLSNAARDHFVEVDVWYVDGKIFLGHDEPTYEV